MSSISSPMVRRHGGLQMREQPSLSDGTAVLALSGAIDGDAAELLTSELRRRVRTGSARLVLDFAEVHFVGSSGIGALIASIAEARDEGGDLIIRRLSADLRHVFEILDLLSYITLDS